MIYLIGSLPDSDLLLGIIFTKAAHILLKSYLVVYLPDPYMGGIRRTVLAGLAKVIR